MSIWRPRRPYSITVSDGAHRDRLRELLDAVVDADNTDVGDMARSSYASEFHFSREVRRLTGESPAALRRRIMLERAAWRLHGGESVSAVAADEGWSSAEVFSRAFSRTFGVPPSRAADIGFRLPAPNGLHFHPPQSLWLDSDGDTKEPDISQLMVAHDIADTAYLIEPGHGAVQRAMDRRDLTRARGARVGWPRTQRRCGARRDRVDEAGVAGHDRGPRLPGPRGDTARFDDSPSNWPHITRTSESAGAQWFRSIPQKAGWVTPSSTRCAIHRSRFSCTASSHTC